MVKTRGGASSKKRSSIDAKAAASASKWQKKETPLPPPLANFPVAFPIAIEATEPIPPPFCKGMRQKARAIKPTNDLSQMTSTEMLWSHPNSPLLKSQLSSPSKTMGSPSVATTGVAASLAKQPD